MDWGWPLVFGGGVVAALLHFLPALFLRRDKGRFVPELEAILGERLRMHRHLVLCLAHEEPDPASPLGCLMVKEDRVIPLDAGDHPELVRALDPPALPAWVVVREGRVVHVATRLQTPAQLRTLLE